MADDVSVSYTVKELVARVDGKIDGLFLLLGSKADKDELDKLAAAVATKADEEKVERLASQVEHVQLRDARASGVSDWVWRVVVSAPGLAALFALFHH